MSPGSAVSRMGAGDGHAVAFAIDEGEAPVAGTFFVPRRIAFDTTRHELGMHGVDVVADEIDLGLVRLARHQEQIRLRVTDREDRDDILVIRDRTESDGFPVEALGAGKIANGETDMADREEARHRGEVR